MVQSLLLKARKLKVCCSSESLTSACVSEWWLVRGGAAAKWDNYLFAVVLQTVITLIAVIMLLVAARQICTAANDPLVLQSRIWPLLGNSPG